MEKVDISSLQFVSSDVYRAMREEYERSEKAEARSACNDGQEL